MFNISVQPISRNVPIGTPVNLGLFTTGGQSTPLRYSAQFIKLPSTVLGTETNNYTGEFQYNIEVSESDSGRYMWIVSDGITTLNSNIFNLNYTPFDVTQDTSLGMSNLFLNPNSGEQWDIVIQDGQILTVTAREYITQKVQQLLRTCTGEVITDPEYGVPYLDEILGVKNPDLNSIKQVIIDVILDSESLKTLGVTGCTITEITLDTKTRNLVIKDLVVITKYAEIKMDGFTI